MKKFVACFLTALYFMFLPATNFYELRDAVIDGYFDEYVEEHFFDENIEDDEQEAIWEDNYAEIEEG